MRYVELLNNIQVPINNEQADLLSRFDIEPTIFKDRLNEREQLIAHQLATLDILLRRTEKNGQITYKKIK
jgi:hypothetical protein